MCYCPNSQQWLLSLFLISNPSFHKKGRIQDRSIDYERGKHEEKLVSFVILNGLINSSSVKTVYGNPLVKFYALLIAIFTATASGV